jgi:hypothetical protein
MARDRDRPERRHTPVLRRRLAASLWIAECPAKHIAYQHTVLCQTALPYRDPGEAVREWERQQGAVSLKVHAGEARNPATRSFVKLGLPYGSRPRLILAHLNRQALIQGSPLVEVEDSLKAFVRRIQQGSSPRGAQIRRFKDQLARLSAATVRLAVDLSEDRAFQVTTQIVSSFELWARSENGNRLLWPATVRLSQEYFDTLTRHAVPLDERALAALANSAMALDLYSWLAQRLHRVPSGRPQAISWQALFQQFGHGFVRVRKFRETLVDVLTLVQTQYPAARVEVDARTGLTLRSSPPPVTARLSLVHKSLG